MSFCRILVVEDEAIVAMDLEGRLARMGYQPVGRVSTGEEALSLVQEQRPNVVLMDIRLQGRMDGIAAAEEIRRRFHVPVIFLTAYSEDATLNRAKLTEPFGYILKPINDQELKSTIEIALYKHRSEQEVRRLKSLYEMHSQVDQAAVRIRTPEELLSAVCRAAVESGALDLAWIGHLDPVTSRILPVAQFGRQSELLGRREFYAGNRVQGQPNPDNSILEGRPYVCNSPCESFCLESSAHVPGSMPFHSCASLPIRFQGMVHYVLTLCTEEREFFQEREVKLLKEVALDISYALDKMEGDLRREEYHEECRSQSELLRTLLDTIPFPAFYKDDRFRYLGCNTAFEALLGVSRERLIGRTAHELWPRDLADAYQDADERLMTSAGAQVYDASVEKPDGDRSSVRFHKATFNNPDGTLGGIIGIVEDVTERKRTEEALAAEVARRHILFEQSRDGIVVLDQNGKVYEANRSFADLLGYSTREVGDLHVWDWESQWTREELLEKMRLLDAAGEHFETRHRRKDGTLVDVGVSAGGAVCGGQKLVFCVCRDLSARKALENALRESEEKYRTLLETCGRASSPHTTG